MVYFLPRSLTYVFGIRSAWLPFAWSASASSKDRFHVCHFRKRLVRRTSTGNPISAIIEGKFNRFLLLQDGGSLLCAIDEANDHNISVWDWQRNEKGHRLAETKVRMRELVTQNWRGIESIECQTKALKIEKFRIRMGKSFEICERTNFSIYWRISNNQNAFFKA